MQVIVALISRLDALLGNVDLSICDLGGILGGKSDSRTEDSILIP